MIDENNEVERFDLDGVPNELLGVALARWMRAIDRAFVDASDADKVWGHVAALTSTMRLLQHLSGFSCDMLALRDLQERLERLTVGQKQPILSLIESIKTPGRPPASYSDHVREVRAVALMQFAIERGWTEADASKLVAKELARVGVKGRRGDAITSVAVRGWFSEKVKAKDPIYKVAMATFAEHAPALLTPTEMRKLAQALITGGQNIRD